MRRTVLVPALFVASVTLFASTTFAQEGADMAPPPSSRTASASFTSANSGHGRGLGVGAVTMLNGNSGALVTWGSRGGGFHVDGFFGLHHYSTPSTTGISLGGRFWYHVHASSFADFSVGGGLGYTHWKGGGPNPPSYDELFLEAGGQIRAFIVPNVALLADLGLGAEFGDFDHIMIGGQAITDSGEGGPFVAGTLGIAYFFE
jgi:hypothetical protein